MSDIEAARLRRDRVSIAAMRAIDPGTSVIRFDDLNALLAQIREQARAKRTRPVLQVVP